MSRDIDLTKALSEEDEQYLLDRGREQEVLRNRAEHANDEEAQQALLTLPVNTVDTATGVPETPREGFGDPEQGEVEGDETDESLENPGAIGATEQSQPGLGNEQPVSADAEDNYADDKAWSTKDLKEELKNRELPTSGTRPELIARLREDDASDSEE